VGLYGLLFSPGKGIFVYCPLLVLSIGGWLAFSRRYRPEAWLIAGFWVCYFLLFAPYKFWTGGFNWGPRFLLPLVPLGYLTLGPLLEGRKPYLAWSMFALLFLLGLAIQLPAILVDHSRYLYQQVFEGGDPSAYNRTIFDGNYSPVVRQWPVALDLLNLYRREETWQAAAKSLEKMSSGSAGLVIPNERALLEGEFFRRNAPDFWWLHPRLLDPSRPVVWILLPWVFLAILSLIVFGWSNVRIWQS
jgi:hypothetical protein